MCRWETTNVEMGRRELLRYVQRRLADGASGPSSLRNQGARGTTAAARAFLGQLNLTKLRSINATGYGRWLDSRTGELQRHLPQGARNWGTARKALNVFMVEVFFNRVLARECRMDRLKDVLETPLDSQAAKKLRAFARRRHLEVPPKMWVRYLTPELNQAYQVLASRMAKDNGLDRASLDLIPWRRGGS
jgi:hypothetical protein